MPRLAGEQAIEARTQAAEECLRQVLVERKAGRKLQEQGAQFRSKPRHLAGKHIQQRLHIGEARLMADRLGQLDGKAERIVRGVGPARIHRGAMRTIEGGIDLDRVEKSGIPFQMAGPAGKLVLHGTRQRPSGATQADMRGLAASGMVGAFRQHHEWRVAGQA